jgi:D-aminoacyl-tRNA deacylase
MRLILQRVSRASVRVSGEVVGRIERGLMVLVGVGVKDTASEAVFLAEKLVNLRIFEDDAGKMNLSLLEVGGSALLVSQFTLYADWVKGRRPSFLGAMPPEPARALFERFCEEVRRRGVKVETGVFGAKMEVELVNAGPVTLFLERGEAGAPEP